MATKRRKGGNSTRSDEGIEGAQEDLEFFVCVGLTQSKRARIAESSDSEHEGDLVGLSVDHGEDPFSSRDGSHEQNTASTDSQVPLTGLQASESVQSRESAIPSLSTAGFATTQNLASANPSTAGFPFLEESTDNETRQLGALDAHEQNTEQRQTPGEQSAVPHGAQTLPHSTQGDSFQHESMGVIERVDMINFMCHQNLSIDLGPRINFIIGHNGSGKSAILTAMTLALGGKASVTSRGSSIKDFVREGANAAEVRVHMRNRGRDAFRPEAYGDAIVVERRILADGNGTWKIRGANGKTVSTKREELDAICDHANIQVDNPMNILTQDAARQFLGSSQPEDKYSFFLRGTQLTQLAQEYELIQTNIQRMKRTMARTEQLLPDLEQDAREANAQWQLVEQARAEQEKLNSMKDELVWSQVIAKENQLATVVESLVRARGKHAVLQRKCEEDRQRANILDEQITTLEHRSGDCHERERSLEEQRSAEIDAMKESRTALANIKAQEREVSQQADRIQHTIRHFQDQIDTETRKLAQDHRAIREEQEQRRDFLNQQRLDNDMEQSSTVQQLDQLRADEQQLDQECASLRAERNTVEEKVGHLEHFLRRCEDAASNRVTAFGGRQMPQILADIQRESRWKKRPVGPLGMHMQLRDNRWAPVVEAVLNDALNAFCVTNHADRSMLTRILQKHQLRVQIFTAAPDLFEYAHGEPDPSILTVLRALQIDDPFITRALITSAEIEKCALVRERAHGDMLLRRAPSNVLRCFSMDLFRIAGGPTGSSTQTLNRATGAPRFVTDTRIQMEEARENLRSNRDHHARIDAKLRSLHQRTEQLQAEIRRKEQDLSRLRQDHRSIRQQIARIEDEMREDEPANVAALEEARNDAQEEMDKIVDRFKSLEASKEKEEQVISPHTTRAEHLREQIEILESERRAIQDELQTVFSERVRLRKNEEYWAAQIASQSEIISSSEREESALSQQIDEWTAQATEYCARVETRRTPESLEKQINAIEAQLAEANRNSGLQLESVIRELRAKNKAYQDARQYLENTQATIATLDRAIQLRLEKWHYFRRHVAIRARTNFALHLQNRGFSGSLHFDHNAQTLKLRVQTGDATRGHDKDPKALSGGEKSFSTICLLLSLWEAIGCPIRCLDEFDVFMDAVNRKVSMKMIIDAAKASRDVQYVLITPQNMTAAALGPYV
ncbi:RNA helicase [Malassezia yamatoensis]|uniref:RNA helicase n=1 Tax=Malassezia yamatoensis TaxID=253288 RepID=A0AAJ5YUN2_9BASI|nr:RNA helicase [Malassezia yamatoensis]